MSRKTLIAITAACLAAIALATGYVMVTRSDTNEPSGGAPGTGAPPEGRQDMQSMITSALDKLVVDGTITDEQAQAVSDALTSAQPSGGGQPNPGAPGAASPSPGAPGGSGAGPGAGMAGGDPFSKVLDELVDDGTLSKAQAQAVSDALTSARPDGGASPPPTGSI